MAVMAGGLEFNCGFVRPDRKEAFSPASAIPDVSPFALIGSGELPTEEEIALLWENLRYGRMQALAALGAAGRDSRVGLRTSEGIIDIIPTRGAPIIVYDRSAVGGLNYSQLRKKEKEGVADELYADAVGLFIHASLVMTPLRTLLCDLPKWIAAKLSPDANVRALSFSETAERTLAQVSPDADKILRVMIIAGMVASSAGGANTVKKLAEGDQSGDSGGNPDGNGKTWLALTAASIMAGLVSACDKIKSVITGGEASVPETALPSSDAITQTPPPTAELTASPLPLSSVEHGYPAYTATSAPGAQISPEAPAICPVDSAAYLFENGLGGSEGVTLRTTEKTLPYFGGDQATMSEIILGAKAFAEALYRNGITAIAGPELARAEFQDLAGRHSDLKIAVLTEAGQQPPAGYWEIRPIGFPEGGYAITAIGPDGNFRAVLPAGKTSFSELILLPIELPSGSIDTYILPGAVPVKVDGCEATFAVPGGGDTVTAVLNSGGDITDLDTVWRRPAAAATIEPTVEKPKPTATLTPTETEVPQLGCQYKYGQRVFESRVAYFDRATFYACFKEFSGYTDLAISQDGLEFTLVFVDNQGAQHEYRAVAGGKAVEENPPIVSMCIGGYCTGRTLEEAESYLKRLAIPLDGNYQDIYIDVALHDNGAPWVIGDKFINPFTAFNRQLLAAIKSGENFPEPPLNHRLFVRTIHIYHKLPSSDPEGPK